MTDKVEYTINLENVTLKKFFRYIYKIIQKELIDKSNIKFKVNILIDFGGDTTAKVVIVEYPDVLVLD